MRAGAAGASRRRWRRFDDDPSLSDRPFVEASEASREGGVAAAVVARIHVSQVTVKNPVVRIIRTERGELNVSTIGKKSAAEKEPPPPVENPPPGSIQEAPITSENGAMTAKPRKSGGGDNLAAVYVQSLLVDNGIIVYEERGANTQTVSINDVDLSVKDFRVTRAFDFALKLAVLSDKQNVDISGTARSARVGRQSGFERRAFRHRGKSRSPRYREAARDWLHRQGDSRRALGARSGFIPGEC